MTPLDRALAAIDALGAEYAATKDRVASDARYQALAAAAVEDDLNIPGGHFGMPAIVAANASSQHWRCLRAKALAHARQAHIKGFPASAKASLTKAAECRAAEHRYLAAERRAAARVAA
ncbi:hypothetical protein GCM10007989_07680 [Devosia pacifica]|uniref:Uncharacterized protein n=1 Tax=Devosia pacifica TaxID=1335967 RepID=A0A918RXR2_9HYPH|nr:hypothetical protein [Devosia pacifica]GHA15376.1 hypothetical protein GCM10007989_07680 [Devosia pacifica]